MSFFRLFYLFPLISVLFALPAMAEPYTHSSQTVEDEVVIRWTPAPALVYTVETTTFTYPSREAFERLEKPDVSEVHESHVCELQNLGHGLLACDLPELGNLGIWARRIVLDTRDQTAMGTRTYISSKRSSQTSWSMVDRWEDGSRTAEEQTLFNITGNVYWVDVADYRCNLDMGEFASCNDRLLDAAQAYFDAELAKAQTEAQHTQSG